MKKVRKIVLTEPVLAVDRHGMNYLPVGTKGVLITKGKENSTLEIKGETYNVPSGSFAI